MSASSKIRHIVRIRQMIRRWRKKAAVAATRMPSDVPTGHVAVTVGSSSKRFVVRATYLNHPMFRNLLIQAEEEYGFTNSGPLAIPCDESFFEEFIDCLARMESNGTISSRFTSFQDFKMDCRKNNVDLIWTDHSRPLLYGIGCHDN